MDQHLCLGLMLSDPIVCALASQSSVLVRSIFLHLLYSQFPSTLLLVSSLPPMSSNALKKRKLAIAAIAASGVITKRQQTRFAERTIVEGDGSKITTTRRPLPLDIPLPHIPQQLPPYEPQPSVPESPQKPEAQRAKTQVGSLITSSGLVLTFHLGFRAAPKVPSCNAAAA